MDENKRNWSFPWIAVSAFLAIFCGLNASCSDSSEKKEDKIAFAAFEKIIEYAVDNNAEEESKAYMLLGYIWDSLRAYFSYNYENKTISVRYYVGVRTPTEKGVLSKMSIEESCGLKDADNYYPVSIRGRWEPKGTGGGDLVVSLTTDNVLEVTIFGDGDFQYWTHYYLDSPDYILEVLNDARKLIAKNRKTEYTPIQAISFIPSQNNTKIDGVEWLTKDCEWWESPYGYECPIWKFYDNGTCSVTDSKLNGDKWEDVVIKGTYSYEDAFTIIVRLEGKAVERFRKTTSEDRRNKYETETVLIGRNTTLYHSRNFSQD